MKNSQNYILRAGFIPLCVLVVGAMAGCSADPEAPASAPSEETLAAPVIEGAAAPQPPVETKPAQIATIRTESGPLRVRNAPSIKGSTVVAEVEDGASFNVLAIRHDGTWVRIELPDLPRGGWVSTSFVELSNRGPGSGADTDPDPETDSE